MNWMGIIKHYPLDALPYEVGFLLLALSMIWYSIVLMKMVNIIREKPIWILPLVGAICVLASVGMHSFAYLVLLPQMDALRTVDEINQMTAFMMKWRTCSLGGILLGGVFSLAGGGVYYRWTTR
jgi:hypothetical protein